MESGIRGLHELDLWLFHLVNGWAGSPLLDQIASYEESLNVLKGGLVLALYWFYWFRPGADRQDRRATIVAAVAGALMALVITRALAIALPFRARPMYDPGIGAQPLALPVDANLEDWSAFPSDSASYFVALAVGFWFLRRPLGVAMVVWALLYICVPRVFLGIHYPSDLAAGALIGIVAAWLTQRPALRDRIAPPFLALERKRPGLFYLLMFLLSYELAVVFHDIRVPLRGILHS